MLSIFLAAEEHPDKTAILEGEKAFTYAALLQASRQLAAQLLHGEQDLKEARIAFMVDPGFNYVKTLWAIWSAGGIAVPLCLTHPFPALEYVLQDTGAMTIVVSPQYAELFQAYAVQHQIELISLNQDPVSAATLSAPGANVSAWHLPTVDLSRRALILYTSGTTAKPKGVVLTHANLEAQISTLGKAWEWTYKDHVLSVLPLHHVHGIVNVVCCSLWAGARLEFIPSFSAAHVFELFLLGRINVFMAVPTIYFKLIAQWESLVDEQKKLLTECLSRFRLMVCGSAALPVTVMEKWKQISGHLLLERYGMTEIGMAISNPLHGERRPGAVGIPLPGVAVRLVDEQQQDVPVGEPGEIVVKGQNVFREYWNNPIATQKEFNEEGWFKTGDVAIIEQGYFRILGRTSVDIIKSGGYKVSALEIEEILRTHTDIVDCAVVGIPDEEWGELIVAAVVCPSGIKESILNAWIRGRIASYKTPRKYIFVKDLPRNAMGKVVKTDLKKLFQ
jgi:malonyl-CoA/methylmalonyl-CoA synthetase